MGQAVIRVIEWTISIEKWTFGIGRYKGIEWTISIEKWTFGIGRYKGIEWTISTEKWTFGTGRYKGDRVDNQYREMDVWYRPL